MSPLESVVGLSMNESFVAADVNSMSEGTPSLAYSMDLYAAFLLTCLGMPSDTLEKQI